MLIKHNCGYRGDTLVEVLFATAVFSLVAVGSLSIMNQGLSSSQRALEITLVRQQIDSQAETLRFLNSSYIAAFRSGTISYTGAAYQWQLIKALSPVVASISSLSNCDPAANPNSFILNTKSATLVPPIGLGKPGKSKTFSQVVYNGNNVSSANGIWIEADSGASSANVNQAKSGYIDFNIRACWDSPGQSVPVTLGTIVRLYEPR